MTDDAPKMIDVKYFSRCLDKSGELKERQECGGLRVGNMVEFEVTLQVICINRQIHRTLRRVNHIVLRIFENYN